MASRRAVILTPSRSSHPIRLLSRRQNAAISPLAATLMDLFASVANKGFTRSLSLLAATLTKNRGEGGVMVNELLSQGKGNLSVRGSRLLGTYERQGHVGCTDDSVVLVHDTEAQRVAPGWQFHIDVIWQSLLLYASEVGGLKRRFYGDVFLTGDFPVGSISGHMKLQGNLLAATGVLGTDRAGVDQKIHPYFHPGGRGRRHDPRVKGYAGRPRRSILHRHSDFRIPLFGGLPFIARTDSIVAMPRAHHCSGTIHF